MIKALNAVLSYEWDAFFQKRVYEIASRAPLGGIEKAGWRLAYTNQVPALLKTIEDKRKVTNMSYSIGLILGKDGEITDALPGTPTDEAGIGSGMKLVAVNERAWSAEILRKAVEAAATNSAPIELLVQNGDYYKTCRLNYHGGQKYPILEREAAKPDLLDAIIKPLTPQPAGNSSAGN